MLDCMNKFKNYPSTSNTTLPNTNTSSTTRALIWTSELNLITFEDIGNLIKEKEIANNVIDGYGEILFANQRRKGQQPTSFFFHMHELKLHQDDGKSNFLSLII